MLAERARFAAGWLTCLVTRRHRTVTATGIGSRMTLCMRCSRVLELRSLP